MKNVLSILPFSLAALVAASPLGDRAVFHNVKSVGLPRVGARRYILQSRVDSPPACAALTSTPSNVTTFPDLSNTTLPLTNISSADNSTVSSAVNSTSPDPAGLQDNSTSTTNSSSVANTTTVATRSLRLLARIAQDDLAGIALEWQDLCLASGGDIFTNEPCVNLAGINGINALLATADPCDQQDNADAMIVFAKSSGVINSDALIAGAIAYRRHPRNTMNILGVVPSTMYCQRAPQSPELVNVFNNQLDGVDPGLFGSPNVPIVPFGEPGTCPFGQTPDVSTCSCVNGTDTSATNGTDTSAADGTASASVSDSSLSGNITATDSLVASGSTSGVLSDVSGSTDTAAATSLLSAAATDISSGSADASVTPALTAPPAATTTAKSTGINFQPTDISGDVNDVDG